MRYVDTPQGLCRFGLAWDDITPPLDIYWRMWGAARGDRATGVHRPLRATVVLFQADDAEDGRADSTRYVVALDHCLLRELEMQRVVGRIAESFGVANEALEVVFSHTHAAGLMTLDRVGLSGGELIPAYLDSIADCVARLIGQAREKAQLASLVYGYGRCDLAAHRDYWDEAAGEFVCGYNPTGPADDTLLMVRATDSQGALLATLVNYACHPTTLAWANTLVSPDFPGAMRELVEQATGAPCVFLQGASGELGPKEGFVGEVEVAERNGRRLGHAALAIFESLPPAMTRFAYTGRVVSGATLGTWDHEALPAESRQEKARWQVRRLTVDLSYRNDLPTVKQVEGRLARWEAEEQSARDGDDETRAAECRAYAERCRRRLALQRTFTPGDTFAYRVAVWRVGDGCWITVEGEPYSQLQRDLRQRFPDVPLVVCALAGGSRCSYLPPAELYGKKIYQEQIALLAAGSLEKITETIGDVVAELVDR